MPQLSAAEVRLINWLDRRQDDMTSLLAKLVNTDSGSSDRAGVNAVGNILACFFGEAGVATEFVRDTLRGDVLIARVDGAARSGRPPILLMGHCDTVFPGGEAGRRPFRVEGGRAYGPGVNDMKSGVVINAFLLCAFAELGGHPYSLVGLFTSDEEIASPFSRSIIERHAREALAVFNAEPARPNGNVVEGRKGALFLRVDVTGRPAHSGVNFFEGASAIHELADKISRFAAITEPAAGTTLNVGLIRGGQTVNTVAPDAVAEIDLRFVASAERDAALRRIESITRDCRVPGTRASLSLQGEFLSLERSPAGERLFRLYRDVARCFDLHVEAEFTGGCADSGFASAQGAPTLCGVGAVGGKSHTPDEFIELPSLVERAKVLGVTVSRVAPSHIAGAEERDGKPSM